MLYYHAVLTGFGVVAIATGFGGCVWSIVRGFRSASWPSVAGEVTDASMDVSWGRGTKLCTPQIRYRYRVDGSDYEGARVFFGWDTFYTESGARKIVERYRPGEPVDVHYNPTTPTSSVLRTGVNIRTWLAAGFFGTLATLCIGALLRTWK